jgi:hemerythrin
MDNIIDPSMSVGDDTIDSQHARLLNQISEIERILSSFNVDMGALRRANQFLITYVREHLKYEEEHMEKHGYPDLENHRKIHAKFIEFTQEFQREFKEKYTSNSFSSVEITELLKRIKQYLEMWVSHIKVVDHKYAEWIKSNK